MGLENFFVDFNNRMLNCGAAMYLDPFNGYKHFKDGIQGKELQSYSSSPIWVKYFAEINKKSQAPENYQSVKDFYDNGGKGFTMQKKDEDTTAQDVLKVISPTLYASNKLNKKAVEKVKEDPSALAYSAFDPLGLFIKGSVNSSKK